MHIKINSSKRAYLFWYKFQFRLHLIHLDPYWISPSHCEKSKKQKIISNNRKHKYANRVASEKKGSSFEGVIEIRMLANARDSLWIHWDNNRECIKGERANKSTTASRLCVCSRFFYLDYIFWGDITFPLFFFVVVMLKNTLLDEHCIYIHWLFSTVILDWNRIDGKKILLTSLNGLLLCLIFGIMSHHLGWLFCLMFRHIWHWLKAKERGLWFERRSIFSSLHWIFIFIYLRSIDIIFSAYTRNENFKKITNKMYGINVFFIMFHEPCTNIHICLWLSAGRDVNSIETLSIHQFLMLFIDGITFFPMYLNIRIEIGFSFDFTCNFVYDKKKLKI